MTIQHGIDHLKKHDSTQNRIYAAMLTTILELMGGKDIPLPENRAKPHSYVVDLPAKVGLVAIADSKYILPDLNPEATAERLEDMGDIRAAILDIAEIRIKAAKSQVPGETEKLPLQHRVLRKGHVDAQFVQDVEELGKKLHYRTRTNFDVTDEGNKLTEMTVGVSEKQSNQSDFDLHMIFQDYNLESIGFSTNNSDGFKNIMRIAMNRLGNINTVYIPNGHNYLTQETAGFLEIADWARAHKVQGVLNLEAGSLDYKISSDGHLCPGMTKTYSYDGDEFVSRKLFTNGVEEISESVSPEEFIDFAKCLLSIVPLQEVA